MRATAGLSAKLERNLLAYATAASAAGIGMLALAQPADAKVVYTPSNIRLGTGGWVDVDLNHDGITEVRLSQTWSCFPSYGCSTAFWAWGQNGSVAGVRGRRATYALPLYAGSTIGSKRTFFSKSPLLARYNTSYRTVVGSWTNLSNRYLGLRFQVNGETHYGWARISLGSRSIVLRHLRFVGKLTGYAYETIPNKAIIAGNRGSTTGQGPDAEPVSLGGLAIGASGIRKHREAVRSPAPN